MKGAIAGGVALIGLFMLLPGGCSHESDEAIQGKLQTVLKNDLDTLVSSLPKASVADTVYFEIRENKKFGKGPFTRLVVADFYFLRNVKVKVMRKYRYQAWEQRWEMFDSQSVFIHE
jgi:hypothetical protein